MIPEGFLRDDTWFEDAAHILIGLVPLWGWFREEAQLPPENDRYPVVYIADRGFAAERTVPKQFADPLHAEYWSAARVMDMRRDHLGYAIGAAIRNVALAITIAVLAS